jgi:hypothetical protein
MLPVFRLPDPEEKTFQSILRQKQSKILFPLARTIRQALPNGGREVGDILCQDRDSIYGRMTLATRQTFAASQSSSMVAFFSRKHSRRA